MTRLPRVSGRAVLSALQRGGHSVTHTRGSHYYLRKADHPGLVVVPVHGNHDLPTGTLRSILHQAGLSIEEFSRLLQD